MNVRVLASIFAAIALFGSLPLWWWLHHQPVQPPPPAALPDVFTTELQPAYVGAGAPAAAEGAASSAAEPTPADATIATEPQRPQKPAPELITGPDPGRSPLADRLNAPEGSIELDLGIVRAVLQNYLLEFGVHPVGSNREITAQLSGRNAQRHAPLPGDLPAISADGELLDRWGTPFFFHALSGREMEIRSAGPDRELYTTDDIVHSPAPASAAAPAGP